MPLNNEIDTLNIHNLDNDIRDTATRNMVAPIENESYATNDYEKGQYLIWSDRKLYKVTTPITHGTTFTVGGNISFIGTLSNEIYNLHVASPDGTKELIGNIEGANASKAYYFGDYIILESNCQLYRVTTNVSMGTAWAVGTNIEHVDNVAKVLTELTQGVHQTRQMITTVEPTNKASKSYEIGDKFVFNNELVEATAHIEQQATITKGTNCKSAKTIEDQISDLNELVNNGAFEYIVWIGDSYTGASSLGENIDKRYSTLVSGLLGLTEKNYAVGGSGFNMGNRNYKLQTDDAVADFTANNLDPTKVKYFIVGGTRNDGIISGSSAAAYEEAVRYVVNTAAGYFTKAEIIVIPMMWDCSFMPIEHLETIKRLHSAIDLYNPYIKRVRIIEKCYTWLSGEFMHILYQNGANVHPDVNGHRILANHVYSAIMGNNYAGNYSYVELSGTWASYASNGHFTIDKADGMIHVHVQFDCTGTFSTSPRLFTFTQSLNAPVKEFFIGQQRFWFNWNVRNATPEELPAGCPAYLDCSYTKTGDAAGTMTYELNSYGDNLQSGNKYYIDLYFKDGVVDNKYNIS